MNLNGAINSQLPHLLNCLPHSQRPALAKQNGKGTALNRPIQKRKRPPLSILSNTQPNRPYAVPLPSAALR